MSDVHKTEISIVIGNYPQVIPIKEGKLKSDLVDLKFIEYDPVHNAFDSMVRDLAFDVCEMAVGTFFQAIDAGKPIKLLPLIMVSKFHHGSLWYDTEYGKKTPESLRGGKVGVRAYTQTTGTWVRGILKEQYGVDSSDITWVTTEGSHVKEYTNPDNVVLEEGSIIDMLHEGKIDAVIMGPETKEPGLCQVIPDVEKAIGQWYDRHHVVPVNHMVAIKEELIRENPEAVKELYKMFCRSYEMSGIKEKNPAVKTGVDACWNAVLLAMRYSEEQSLLSHVLDKSQVFPEFLL